MTTNPPTALAFYPPAPMNGGCLTCETPGKIGDWGWEPKIDDWRGVCHAPSSTVWNQYGVPSTVEKQGKIDIALAHIRSLSFAVEWLDIGIMENRHDMMRGCIVVFDIMGTSMTLTERRAVLNTMFPTLPPAPALLEAGTVHDRVYLIPQWRNLRDPLALQQQLQDENAKIGRKFYEGLVAKLLSSLYPNCQRAKTKISAWQKHRFDQP